uniref:C2 PI3K-type domain-containing protein n=1 Tax=Heliothis virescens TaxID=7102 RepID=A0A2A4JYP3_HELVI
MNEIDDKFYYVYSSSLDHKVEIKIGTLEGKRAKPEYDKLLSDPMLKFSGLYQEGCSDLYVTCQILSDGQPLALPVTTSYKSFSNRWNWNEWVTLPVYFSDLPRNATLAMTIYDCAGPGKLMVVGGTTISLFGKHGMLRQGMFDLRVWPGVEGSEKTPGKAPDRGKEQMQRLAKLAKKHRNGHIPKVDWLDRLTFREIEMINEKEKRSSDYMYLMVEFPTVQIAGINHAVVYYEQDGDEMYQFRAQADIVTVPDYEILQENLVESKQHRLARSLRSGVSGRDAKPTAAERDQLAALVAAPPARPLTATDQDLLWKFRFYLSSHRRALTKFLECVNWNRPGMLK